MFSGGLFLLLVVCFFIFEHQKSLSIIPSQDYNLVPFSDDFAGGNSKIIYFKGDSSEINFKYQIGNQSVKYAGFNIVLSDSLEQLVSNYNQIKIKLSAENVNAISFSAKTWEKGITTLSDDRSLRPNHLVIKGIEEGKTSSFTVGFEELSTKDWWLSEFLGGEQIDKNPDWTKTKQLAVLRASEVDSSKPGLITLKELSLEKKHTWFYIISALLFVVLWLNFLIQIFKRTYNSKVEITYKPIEIKGGEGKTNLEDSVLNYIAHEYSNSELKLENLSQEFRVGERIISSIIHKKFQISFKKYLNAIRINEGKKLLKESDLSIKEITYQVGYSSPNNFRRVFKKNEGVAPSDYRDQAKESKN